MDDTFHLVMVNNPVELYQPTQNFFSHTPNECELNHKQMEIRVFTWLNAIRSEYCTYVLVAVPK